MLAISHNFRYIIIFNLYRKKNVIAEGIETEKQVNILKTTQCDCIQGYYYSSALSKNEYEAFLRKNDFE